MRKKLFGLLIFAVVAVVAFFGVQFVTKSGIFKVYGVLNINEKVPEDIKSTLSPIINEEIRIDHDVEITVGYSVNSNKELECSADEINCKVNFLYDILIPVTDFYNPENSIQTSNVVSVAESLVNSYFSNKKPLSSSDNFVSIFDLKPNQKVLAIDSNYYLDTLDSGAIFIYISIPIQSEKNDKTDINSMLDEDEKKVVDLIKPALKEFPTKESVLTFSQTGVTALSRKMLTKLNQVGGDASYFAQNIKDFLSSKDLTHISNESSFTNYATSSNICADPRMIGAITAIGTDIVELTGNHNLDCGDEAAISTIDQYDELGMKTVGGGKSAEDAAKPLLIDQKGTGITFLAYNQSTGGATYDNTPGANQYDEEDVINNIASAKERGDTVIIDIQYYECSNYDNAYDDNSCDYANSSAGDQVGFFRHLIDLGADIVVGTSAHQPQTFELYGNGAIYYGLGNLFFDQIWWPGTTRSLILTHYFWKGKLLNTRITPTVYDADMQVKIMDEETAKWFVNRLSQVRP